MSGIASTGIGDRNGPPSFQSNGATRIPQPTSKATSRKTMTFFSIQKRMMHSRSEKVCGEFGFNIISSQKVIDKLNGARAGSSGLKAESVFSTKLKGESAEFKKYLMRYIIDFSLADLQRQIA